MRATSAYFSINGIPEIKLPWDYTEQCWIFTIWTLANVRYPEKKCIPVAF